MNYIINTQAKIKMMETKTLFNLVDSIQVSRIRLSCQPLSQSNNLPWTKEQEKLFYKLILEYGTDIGLIQSFFPNRTRNQVKRKYRDICAIRGRAIQRQEQRKLRQCRKSYFDEQILELKDLKLIKWPSKPNNMGNSTSENLI